MEMETENHHHQWRLLQPLIPPNATSHQSPTTHSTFISNNSDIILRLLIVFFIGLVSIWANHESSRFFDITVVNEFRHTPAGKLFNLGYVSNDKASNMILEATVYVGHRLYNETHVMNLMKELISHVTLRAVDDNNLKNTVTVDFTNGYRRFSVNVSLSLLEPEKEMVYALRRGMARVWLWDSITELTSDLIEGIVEYVAVGPVDLVGDVEDYYAVDVKNPRVVADLLSQCERRTEGFVRRLVDRISKDRWREGETFITEVQGFNEWKLM